MKLGVVMLPTISALRKLRQEDLSKTVSEKEKEGGERKLRDTEAR